MITFFFVFRNTLGDITQIAVDRKNVYRDIDGKIDKGDKRRYRKVAPLSPFITLLFKTFYLEINVYLPDPRLITVFPSFS